MGSRVNVTDCVGDKYGRMTIKEFVKKENGHKFYKVECDCGEERIVRLSSLTSGNTNSCGCYGRERSAEGAKKRIKHGMHSHPLYSTWFHIKERCYSVNSAIYTNYGGRGIQMCEDWQEDFMSFYNWAITDGGWKKGLTIERKDVNGNYCPENCVFATTAVQSRNKRNSRFFTINGVTKNWIDWCREYGLPESTVRNRMQRQGLSIEEALTASKQPGRKRGGVN